MFYRLAGADTLSNIGQSDRKMEAHVHSMRLHIGYMRSLEDSERVHAACVQYLQTSLIHVYPERPDIVQQMQDLAAQLGGHLTLPQLSWKYSLLGAVFGIQQAKRWQGKLRSARWTVVRRWDRDTFAARREPRDRNRLRARRTSARPRPAVVIVSG